MMDINPSAATLVDLLRWRAAQTPHKQAYTFLEDGEAQAVSMTYAELDQQARAIASHLQRSDGVGKRALLLYPSGLEYIAAFFGCLYAGVLAVPLYPPRSRGIDARIQAISQDAQATFALTTATIAAKARRTLSESPELARLQWLATDTPPTFETTLAWSEPELTESSLAYLQYTSGSTSTPKGVMVSHSNLLYNLSDFYANLDHALDDVVVSWLPLFHDMGLIFGILYPLYRGLQAVFMAPTAFIQQPKRWLQAISTYRGTHSTAPNFAYDLCVEKVTAAQRVGLDLRSWRFSINGAEPVQASTLKRFTNTFGLCGFAAKTHAPGYGLAEATLKVTLTHQQIEPIFHTVNSAALAEHRVVEGDLPPESHTLVACGAPTLETQVIIVEPETRARCLSHQVGEIWVGGPTVAQGYWRNEEATRETFQAYLADTGEGPFLRTGDLGFLRDGQLFVTGRLKDMIIIRGHNHYPQDIELTAKKSHPALETGWGAAFSVSGKGADGATGIEQLVVVQEVERTAIRTLDSEGVMQAIRRAIVEEHEIQPYAIVLIKPGHISKTTSGKVQRHACRDEFLKQTLAALASWQAPPTAAVTASTITNPRQSLHSDRAQAMVTWLRKYATTRINSRLIDERRMIPPHIILDLGNQGFLGLQVPEQYGGMGLNYQDTLWIYEQVAAIDLTLGSFVAVHNALGIRPILNYASPQQRHALLPKVATGREIAAFALTEPGAGSNPRAMAATATPTGNDTWQLNGQKSWIGNGSWAGVVNVFVQLLDKNQNPIGITGFVLPQDISPLRHGAEALTLGVRGMVQNTVYLDGTFVEAAQLLGKMGEGMQVAQDTMMFARLAIAAMSVGGMKRCAQLMLRYAQRRQISTGRLLENPVTVARLNKLTAAITVVETFTKRLAEFLDKGIEIPEEAYIACKTSGPEFLGQAVDALVQLLGGRGYIETNIAPQLLRDARIFRIFEGPTETLNMFLGSRVYHKSEGIHQFMELSLGAPIATHQFQMALAQIKTDYLDRQPPELPSDFSSPFADSLFTNRWVYAQTGELATLALLWAALEGEANALDTTALNHGLRWIRMRFTQKLAQIRDRSMIDMMQAETDLERWIEGYTDSIGDIEQQLPGEDHELDPLLRQKPDISTQTQSRGNSEAEVEVPSDPAPAPTAMKLSPPGPPKVQGRTGSQTFEAGGHSTPSQPPPARGRSQ
ncbi:MAG: AMP-binding protein, partial [Anaerolineae bacterium]|nr:AMP-binding protein [Anaerolineae bacterium]